MKAFAKSDNLLTIVLCVSTESIHSVECVRKLSVVWRLGCGRVVSKV